MVISLLIFLTLFSILDGHTTWLILQHKKGYERNPLCLFIMQKYGIAKGLILSKSFFFIVTMILYSMGLLDEGLGFFLLCAYVTLYGGILTNNIFLIDRLFKKEDAEKELV